MLQQMDVPAQTINQPTLLPKDREIPLSDNALTVLRKRYLVRGLTLGAVK